MCSLVHPGCNADEFIKHFGDKFTYIFAYMWM